MKKLRFLSSTIAVTLLAIALCACSSDDDPTPTPPPSTKITVTYKVANFNDLLTADIIYKDATGADVTISNATLPWTVSFTADIPFSASLHTKPKLKTDAIVGETITLTRGYEISCTGASEDRIYSSSTLTIAGTRLSEWLLSHANDKHTTTFN